MAQEDALRAGETVYGETPEQRLYRIAVEMAREATREHAEMVETILAQRKRLRDAEVAVPDDMNRVLEMVQRIDTRLTLLESAKEDAAPGPRVRLFVTEVISPIKESVSEIKTAMKTLTDESKELYEAHKAFINAEQKRKEDEAKEKTLGATLKRWGAISAAVGSILVLLRVAGTILELYIQGRAGK